MAKKGYPFDSFPDDTIARLTEFKVNQNLINFVSSNIYMNAITHRHDHVNRLITTVLYYIDAIETDVVINTSTKRISILAVLLCDIARWYTETDHSVVASDWVYSLKTSPFSLEYYGIHADEVHDIASAIAHVRGRNKLSTQLVHAARYGTLLPTDVLRGIYLHCRAVLCLDVNAAVDRTIVDVIQSYRDNGTIHTQLPTICKQYSYDRILQLSEYAEDKNRCRIAITRNIPKWEVFIKEMKHD